MPCSFLDAATLLAVTLVVNRSSVMQRRAVARSRFQKLQILVIELTLMP